MIFKPKIHFVTYFSFLIATIIFILLAMAYSQAIIFGLIAVCLLVTILTLLKIQTYAMINKDMLTIKRPFKKEISINLNSINFIAHHNCLYWRNLKLTIALYSRNFLCYKSKDKPMKMENILGWSKADTRILFSYLEKDYSHIETELYFKDENHF